MTERKLGQVETSENRNDPAKDFSCMRGHRRDPCQLPAPSPARGEAPAPANLLLRVPKLREARVHPPQILGVGYPLLLPVRQLLLLSEDLLDFRVQFLAAVPDK